ncbi:MAG TPA: hypothetical protein PLV68_08160, partial [Ilumatobacteraceae bacterium]|nr:hypothetical protein [Ilumatobacteraceae bacterium]
DAEQPVQPDGHLRPEWALDDGTGQGWSVSAQRLARWAAAAMAAVERQGAAIAAHPARARLERTVRSESSAELLGAEMAHGGLPFDLAAAEHLIGSLVG